MFECGDLVLYGFQSYVIEHVMNGFCRFKGCSWYVKAEDLTLIQKYLPTSTCEQSSCSLELPQLPLSLDERKVIALERIGLALEMLANAKG